LPDSGLAGMTAITHSPICRDASVRGERLRGMGPGVLFSLLLHFVFAALVALLIFRNSVQPPQALVRFMPIDLVQPGPKTTSPPQRQSATMPRQKASRVAHDMPSAPHRPVSFSPAKKRTPPDALEIRLKALAELREPDAILPLPDNTGISSSTATSDSASAGAQAAYRVRDFLRAQVVRRWSLDLRKPHDVAILIHVVVARDGTVKKAEIVDRARYASDAAWRAVALSARNAVLLSSPLTLPADRSAGSIDTVLALNPRDAMR